MDVEIAVIDADGWRSEIQLVENVTHLEHERGSPDNGWMASMEIDTEDGHVTITGDGFGLEVVGMEEGEQ